jgi:hypothetical protein
MRSVCSGRNGGRQRPRLLIEFVAACRRFGVEVDGLIDLIRCFAKR